MTDKTEPETFHLTDLDAAGEPTMTVASDGAITIYAAGWRALCRLQVGADGRWAAEYDPADLTAAAELFVGAITRLRATTAEALGGDQPEDVTATTEQGTTVRADEIQPGDRIHYAGEWRPVRATATVVKIYTTEGWRLEYEADCELDVQPAPAEETSAGSTRARRREWTPGHHAPAETERVWMACPVDHVELPCDTCGWPGADATATSEEPTSV